MSSEGQKKPSPPTKKWGDPITPRQTAFVPVLEDEQLCFGRVEASGHTGLLGDARELLGPGDVAPTLEEGVS